MNDHTNTSIPSDTTLMRPKLEIKVEDTVYYQEKCIFSAPLTSFLDIPIKIEASIGSSSLEPQGLHNYNNEGKDQRPKSTTEPRNRKSKHTKINNSENLIFEDSILINSILEDSISASINLENFKSKTRTQKEKGPATDRLKICEICSKAFKTNQLLQRHLLLHTNAKQYKCEICDKEYRWQCALESHMVTHSDDRPFGCELCDAKFKEKRRLAKHMIVHTNNRRYSCDTCKKLFRDNYHLLVHIRTHTGERPYVCEICDKKLSSSNSLTRHMLIHEERKDYICEVCHWRFREKTNLKYHMRIHAEGRKCGKHVKSKGADVSYELVNDKEDGESRESVKNIVTANNNEVDNVKEIEDKTVGKKPKLK